MKNTNLVNHSSFFKQKIFFDKSWVCQMTEISEAMDFSNFDGYIFY